MGNFKEVAVIDVLVKPGDAVEVDGPLVTLETEKATMDVPSTVAGIIEKVIATKGGTVSPGDVVATVQVRRRGRRRARRCTRTRRTGATPQRPARGARQLPSAPRRTRHLSARRRLRPAAARCGPARAWRGQ